MIVTIDFETYYAKNYSLRGMTEVEYILSPLFQPIICSVKRGDADTIVYPAADLRAQLSTIDWESTALLSHNIRFDGAILYWHYGVRPKLYLDTLSMARAVTHPLIGKSSLAAVTRYMGLPAKGDAVVRAIEKRAEDFTQAELAEYADYCAHDTELCHTIFKRFMQAGFPTSELAVIDLSARCFIEPQARLNQHILAEHLNMVRAEKAASLARLAHVPPDVFSSNKKFAELLESLGVDVPRKISPVTGQETWALAKNDRDFRTLCEDTAQPADVQAACACRLGVKSTIEETRTATMLDLSQRVWGDDLGTGWMPVPYKYYAAHTGRFGGDGGFNFANLRRGSRIREAIEAPPGYRVVHRDSSQIECRLLAELAGCARLTSAFRQGRDVYSEFASGFYSFNVSKAHPKHRFVGKTCVLGLGYGMGGPKLRHTLYIGNGGMSVTLDDKEAWQLVNMYRSTYPEICQLWQKCDIMLQRMILAKNPQHPAYNVLMSSEPPVIPVVRFATDAIVLPNGLAIQYPDLRQETRSDGAGWETIYDAAMEHATKKIYGAKVVENIVQALARIVVTNIALRVWERCRYRPFMSTYDSHDYIVPEAEAEAFDRVLTEEFAVPPPWLPGLPLASEGGWGTNLSAAEKGLNQ
jgi:DNA polymerase family A